MEHNKETATKFLDLLMFKYYTDGNIMTDEEDLQVRSNFRLQMKWCKRKAHLPKTLTELL